jgi:hypothetical protein
VVRETHQTRRKKEEAVNNAQLALFIEFLFFISHLHDIELPVQILPRSKINSDICEENWALAPGRVTG